MVTLHMDKESKIELPYKVLDVGRDDERLIISFKSFKRHQDSFSIQRGGLLGDFEVCYKCNGIDCRFECELTPGNLQCFYYELDNVYEGFPGTVPVAVLENTVGEAERTKVTFRLDQGRFYISGCIKNKNNDYKSGIIFDFDIDCIYISEILTDLDNFINALADIQGHRNFF